MVASASPQADWSAAGPVLAPEMLDEVASLLDEASRLGPLEPQAAPVDHPSAAAAVSAALTTLGPVVLASAASTGDEGLALLRIMRALDRMDRRLAELAFAREARALERLTRVMTRLSQAEGSVQELLSAAPEIACQLGFDRVLLSRVEDDTWHAELMFILGDPVWAAEIVDAGRKKPHPLAEAHNEAKMVANRTPILVTGVRYSDDGRWGNQLMVEASRTRSYVAAPIVASNHVIGMLHADCYGERRDVDELDRDLLGAFTQMLSLVLERAAGARPKPSLRLQQDDGQPFEELVIRTGRPPADPLIESLTPREFEVLRLLAAGCTNTAIARELSIADDTAKQHVKHILRKLQAGNRSAAVARYFRAAADQR